MTSQRVHRAAQILSPILALCITVGCWTMLVITSQGQDERSEAAAVAVLREQVRTLNLADASTATTVQSLLQKVEALERRQWALEGGVGLLGGLWILIQAALKISGKRLKLEDAPSEHI